MIPLSSLFGSLPPTLRDELLDRYVEIVHNFRERRWEPAELNGGKLCEVVYTILKGLVDGNFPSNASKPSNMLDACRALEHADQSRFSRSVRIQIPRVLIALYEIRNNRGVGHVGGDVNPNAMDAAVVVGMAKWVLSELVRLFHTVPTSVAETSVDAITERIVPLIWHVNDVNRVLNPALSVKNQILLLLYHKIDPCSSHDLLKWTEYGNRSRFKSGILRELHKSRLIEYDSVTELVALSPLGSKLVEDEIL